MPLWSFCHFVNGGPLEYTSGKFDETRIPLLSKLKFSHVKKGEIEQNQCES